MRKGERPAGMLSMPAEAFQSQILPYCVTVHVLGFNVTALMEDLPKGDVKTDIFFLIVYLSSLIYLFLKY